ncbi:hypothetical protein EVAR_53231_1 [Eumeta japonica]|uniref:Uncharacterized protein n=1 Tax=Eumeta variegata TaxID=151549 RepID=A0A4C1XBU5_EUMVA|nr:hypothetical protein EVAR_53231_1 [Eumeta japonica]
MTPHQVIRHQIGTGAMTDRDPDRFVEATPLSSARQLINYSDCRAYYIIRPSTTIRTPEKVLFMLYVRLANNRKMWLQLALRDTALVVTQSKTYFCEDHFVAYYAHAFECHAFTLALSLTIPLSPGGLNI